MQQYGGFAVEITRSILLAWTCSGKCIYCIFISYADLLFTFLEEHRLKERFWDQLKSLQADKDEVSVQVDILAITC